MGGSGEEILFLEKNEIWEEIAFFFDKKLIKIRLTLNELCIEKNIVGTLDLILVKSGKLWMSSPQKN